MNNQSFSIYSPAQIKNCLPFLLLFSVLFSANAQRNEMLSSEIKTLQVVVNDNWQSPPVMELNSDEFLTISFDHLTPEYVRYLYKIEHCNADWTVSDLLDIDYLNGFNDNPIEDYAPSFNTTMLYNHYWIEIPNNNVQLTASGNYKVTIYEDDSPDTPVARAYFSILEQEINIAATVSSNTDIDTNATHQQLSFTVNHNNYEIRNPQSELKVQVFQNQRWDNRVTDLVPTYISGGKLDYAHNRKLIFKAGNEYRKFELTNVHYNMQGIDKVRLFDPYYHADLLIDERRKNYSYDVDQNGRFYIRELNAHDSNTEADYIFFHFSLEVERPFPDGAIYLQGAFTNNFFDNRYQLTYNAQEQCYESVQILKQGSYNYQYLYVPGNSTIGQTAPIEGDFFETENEYMIMVYHRPFGGRHDRLIGMHIIRFQP